jgi:hypothetical protein
MSDPIEIDDEKGNAFGTAFAIGACLHVAVIMGVFVTNDRFPGGLEMGGMVGRILGALFWAWVLWLIGRAFGMGKDPTDKLNFIYGFGLFMLVLLTIFDVLRYLEVMG